jgi:phage gpG-like protein
MCIQEITSDVPKWTDIVSAISAAIGVPMVLYTLYKLMKKDKERESEINSLATIATQLTEMQAETEKRYKASKKPHIEIKLEQAQQGNRIKLDFTNTNSNVSLKQFQLINDKSDLVGTNATTTTINDVGGKQKFSIILNGKEEPIAWMILRLDYTTEEGYVFIQYITVWIESEHYFFSPSVIIDKENGAF